MNSDPTMFRHTRTFIPGRRSLAMLLAGPLSLLAASPQRLNDDQTGAPWISQPILWAELGAKATVQNSGDGLAVFTTEEGVVGLRCSFQQLAGEVTYGGLWLTSTARRAPAERLRVVAEYLGRDDGPMVALPECGVAWAESGRARYVRRGLVEEYGVSMDGVQQDFVVAESPGGRGELRLDLTVNGARAEKVAGGVQLVLEVSGRKLVYGKLNVMDANERSLDARLEVVSQHRLAVIVADTGAVYPVRIDPTFSDANWVSMGGTDGLVYATVVDPAGNLYIGGAFTFAGSVQVNGIAMWNGSNWSALGSGMDNAVYTLALSGGNLYAGGRFTMAGGNAANYVAKWDGSAWSALGSGVNYSVWALAVSGTDLFAGGWFTKTGDNVVNYIAKWDGSTWSALGSGMDDWVTSLVVSGTDLYAGGWFIKADGIAANCVAKWDGNTWSALGSGMGGASCAYPYIYALATSGSDLYAGGCFTTAGDGPANCVAKWDGNAWSALGSGMDHVIYALALSSGNLYAGGGFTMAGGNAANYVARWDGNGWSALGSGMDDWVRALAVSGSDLYAGGQFSTAGGKESLYIAKATDVNAPLDSDGDGMPDNWEVAHGLNPNDPSDAALDSDGDGFSNLQEYLAGTDPQDSADALAFSAIQADSDNLQLSFRTVSGRVYRVDRSDASPDGPWTAVGDLITGDGALHVVSDPGGAAQFTRFYRLVP